jgi:hypothetical protein
VEAAWCSPASTRLVVDGERLRFFSLASARDGDGEAAVARGCFPADVRSTTSIPAATSDDSCGTATQLGC